MKPARPTVRLDNPCNLSLPALEEQATVDFSAMHLRIPQRVAQKLGLKPVCRREVTDMDGQRRSVPYVGPIEVQYMDRRCYVGAIALGDEVSLRLLVLDEMYLTEPVTVRALK